MPDTYLERRRKKRVRARLPLRIDYNNNEALASTKNISLLGACCDMNSQILPGTRVAVSLDIPKYVDDSNLTGEVRGEGAVVRCQPHGGKENAPAYELGIFFSNFMPPGEEKLANYLNHMARVEEQEVREWVEQYRSHIKKRKKEIARKRRIIEKKRQDRLERRLKREQEKANKVRRKRGRPRKIEPQPADNSRKAADNSAAA